MINGEYGNVLRVSAQEDILANVNSLTLRSPSSYVTTKLITEADGLEVGLADKTAGGIDFIANEYVEYLILEGDITHAGDWEVCLISLTPSGENKIVGSLTFLVEEC